MKCYPYYELNETKEGARWFRASCGVFLVPNNFRYFKVKMELYKGGLFPEPVVVAFKAHRCKSQ